MPHRLTALLALALAAALAGCSADRGIATAKRLSPTASTPFHGLIPDLVRPRAHFTLTDTTGRPFDFFARTRGHATLLYFGYTNCPDECPTTLHDIHDALTRVSAAVAADVRVVFVTTDPQRDTPPVLAAYLRKFDPRFIALRGTVHQVDLAEASAGLPPAQKEKVAGATYGVSHAAVTTGYSAADVAPVLYLSGTHVTDYAADLPLLVHPNR